MATQCNQASSIPTVIRRHLPQIDGLRTIAVGMVLIHHFLSDENAFRESFRWGWGGVRLFFVLSGYLVTNILLSERDASQKRSGSRFDVLIAFYARRTLRIFPLYYAYIGLLCLTKPMREYWLWFFTYMQNFLIFKEGNMGIVPGTGHLWTLAIEEQFYLVWPMLMLFVPRRFLWWTLSAVLLLGPISRLSFQSFYDPDNMVFTLCNLDTLCMGAILAALRLYYPNQNQLTKLLKICGLIGFLFIVIFTVLWNFYDVQRGESTPEFVMFVVGDFFFSFFCVWLIDSAARGFGGPFGKLLETRFMVDIGKMSYGIYVLHVLVEAFFIKSLSYVGFQGDTDALWMFVPKTLMVLVVAWMSWTFFERPINQLKDRIPYLKSYKKNVPA